MKYLLTMICALLLFCGCNNDDKENTDVNETDTISRTVIVYMNAENNLSETANNNLSDMCSGSKDLGKKENLIVFFDNSSISTTPCIYRVSGGQKTIVKKYDKDFISTDPSKMKEVLQWIVSNYPANSYGLILWGHADGWIVTKDTIAKDSVSMSVNVGASARKKCFGVDNGKNTTSNTGYWINITTLNEVFDNLPKFKFIFSDCCNMQCVECAYELKNKTELYIGSPAEIPADGAPYSIIVPDLFDETDNIGKRIVDDYFYYYSRTEYRDSARSVPLSVVKTSELNYLASITASKLATFMPKIGRYPLVLPTDSIVYYNSSSSNIKIMYDMQGFMHKYLSPADYAEWKAQYDKTVIYKLNCKSWMTELSINFNDFNAIDANCGCMSMFVPLMSYQNYVGDLQYNENIKNYSWYNAVRWNDYGW
jgi:hypothetical protein